MLCRLLLNVGQVGAQFRGLQPQVKLNLRAYTRQAPA